MEKNIHCPQCKSEKVNSDGKKSFSNAFPLIFSGTEVTGFWGIVTNAYLLLVNVLAPGEGTKILNCSDCGHTFIYRK
jgi:hypothetical protein